MSNQKTMFTVIAQEKYGEPREVLRLLEVPLTSLAPRENDVLIHVTKRPIHPGDIHMVRGSSKGGPVHPIADGQHRVPGFEGVGIVERMGVEAARKNVFAIGQRVAFFDGGARAWGTKVVVASGSVMSLPDDINDDIAAQLLINTITALVVLRKAHDSLPPDISLPVSVLQSAAGSAVGRLITQIALDRGVRPIRLVRSHQGATLLNQVLPGAPIIVTGDVDWKDQVRKTLGRDKLAVAIDSVGGKLLGDIVALVDSGATIVSFGTLDDGQPDVAALAPRGIALSGATMGSWFKTPAAERASDLQLALELARRAPELFSVAQDYPFEKFQGAIEHVSRPGKTGTVLLTS